MDLTYTPQVASATAAMAERLRAVIPPLEWPVHAPYVAAIAELKRQRNAVVLAHNYQTPEIYHGVADFTGDSLALAEFGARTEAEVIVLAGVHFMAETAKILSPDKTVLIPDLRAGCSLAASITAQDIRLLRQRYPGVPVVTYVNTSAAVKAESDICCTSANAVAVVESLGVPRVIFLPDEYLGRYVAEQTTVEVILWRGHCEVHERFTGDELRAFRAGHAGIQILAHPECPPDVLAEADFVGSTAAMIRHVGTTRPSRVVMVTECSMSDNVAVEFPDVQFVRPCQLCPHMKRITLPKILHSLETMEHQVQVDPAVAGRARQALARMLAVGRREVRQ
jgi:quinolinate synthase